jgi:hypothetical protein
MVFDVLDFGRRGESPLITGTAVSPSFVDGSIIRESALSSDRKFNCHSFIVEEAKLVPC